MRADQAGRGGVSLQGELRGYLRSAGVTTGCVNEQFTPTGRLLQERDTGTLKLPVGWRTMLADTVLQAGRVIAVGFAVRARSVPLGGSLVGAKEPPPSVEFVHPATPDMWFRMEGWPTALT